MRLFPWLALTAVLFVVAGMVPGLRGLTRMPILGLLLTSMLAAALLRHWEAWQVQRKQTAASIRDLSRVETPEQQGKLGSLLLSKGKARQALEPLQNAAQGDPGRLEWRYRLGCCELELGRPAQALEWLEDVVAREEEHAFGAAIMRLIECRFALGEHSQALAALERFERNHGPNPESAYRRGQALLELGQREAGKSALAEVPVLMEALPAAHRKPMRAYAIKAKALGSLR